MKKLFFTFILSFFLITACAQKELNEEKTNDSENLKSQMTEAEAKVIAENSCIKGGGALDEGLYNENSKTWWFDANLNATQPGCMPSCVVSEETKTAEINWRCTGGTEMEEENNNPVEEDRRILINDQNISEYTADPEHATLCDSVVFNNNPANTSVDYNNPEMGVTFSVPYNQTWGSDKFKITPYNELYGGSSMPAENLNVPIANILEAIEFGPIKNEGPCMWHRLYKISFVPKNSAEELIKAAEMSSETSSSGVTFLTMEPEIIKLAELTVVKYSMGTVCDNLIMEVLGEKYNYRFSIECSTEPKKDLKTLEDIVKSVKLNLIPDSSSIKP